MKVLRCLATLALVLAFVPAAQAGSFSTDFSSQPAGTTLFGDAAIGGGFLTLTPPTYYQEGSFIVPDFSGGSPVTGFTASFSIYMGDPFESGGVPADGISFNFANDLPAGSFGEEGAGSGLTISFDTFNNFGSDHVGIDLKSNGTTIASDNTNPYTISSFFDVFVDLHLDGTLDLDFNHNSIFSGVQTGYTPLSGGAFGVGGRTGGAFEGNYIDNLVITTQTASVPEPSSFALLGLGGIGTALTAYRRRRATV